VLILPAVENFSSTSSMLKGRNFGRLATLTTRPLYRFFVPWACVSAWPPAKICDMSQIRHPRQIGQKVARNCQLKMRGKDKDTFKAKNSFVIFFLSCMLNQNFSRMIYAVT
jgi:hypothetical protein